MSLILQTTQPALSSWTPDAVIRVIAELMVAALAVIGAWKGIKGDAKADVLNSRADSLAEHARSLDRQITDVAKAMPTGTGDGGNPPAGPPEADPFSGVPRVPQNLSGLVGPYTTGYPIDRLKDQL